MSISRWIRAAVSLCLLALSAPVSAQTVYKSTMPNGRVVYGPEPAAGAKKVEAITTKTQDAGVRLSTPIQKQGVDHRAARQQEQAQREAELEQLRLAVQRAEAARDGGKEPQDGETIGNAKGGTRLTEEYFDRQKRLEDAVQEARKRLQEAQNAR